MSGRYIGIVLSLQYLLDFRYHWTFAVMPKQVKFGMIQVSES